MSHSSTGYLIDPEARTIEEVTYNGHFTHVYDLIDAELFDVARIDGGDGIFVDDDGLFQDRKLFVCRPYPYPLAGKGLMLGTDAEGNSVSPKMSIDELKKRVAWVDVLVPGVYALESAA